MRIMITGGAGFIGSALVRYLVNEVDAEVLNLDKLTYAGNLESLASVNASTNYRFIHGDICNHDVVVNAISAFKPDRIMHLAAESHVDRSIAGPEDFIQTNVVGTFTLLEAARNYWIGLDESGRGAFRFLHVSTDEVYGSLGQDGLFTETTAYDPSSPYSASKAASDHLASAWFRTYGFPVIISNCSNNYGPCQFPEKLIPLNIINALEGRAMPVYGDGSNRRDWLHVEDHVRALHLICSQGLPGEVYNIGGRNEHTNIEVVRHICKLMDELRPSQAPHDHLITFVADRPGHDQRYAIDATKLEMQLGWRAQENFTTGMEKTVRWYLDNETWWRSLRTKVYVGERLGAPEL